MTILFRNEQKKLKVNTRLLKKRIQQILENLGLQNSEISILLVTDAKIRKLNAQYRNIDKPTDVLSFPQDNDGLDELDIHLLGDVVISVETAKRQAREHGHTFSEELTLLLIHGILHLTGLDHERSSKEAKQMRQKTNILFQEIFNKSVGDCNYW